MLALLLLLTTLIPHWRNYTDITFILLSAWLVYLLIKKEYPVMQHFLPAYGIIFFPFLIVNGALTGTGFEEPIVWYNNTEILSIRLLTIPVEDIFYGMLLILANVYIFEKLQSAHEKT
ncbi:MAG: lycopene cyclase domain-containing protein [Bacteroidota bacterium]